MILGRPCDSPLSAALAALVGCVQTIVITTASNVQLSKAFRVRISSSTFRK